MTLASGIQQRRFADIFDLRADGDPNKRGDDFDPEAIGGCYGMAWDEYFTDQKTGEVYAVRCSDGVNGGNGTYRDSDEERRHAIYADIVERCKAGHVAGVENVRISKNERRVLQGFTHAVVLMKQDGGWGEQSSDGIDGGLMGYHRGIPVICDPTMPDIH